MKKRKLCLLLASLLLLHLCACAGGPAANDAPAGDAPMDAMAWDGEFNGLTGTAVMEPGAPMGAPMEEGVVPVEHNTEEYSAIAENPFLSAQTTPLSTFAADVDTASYSNVRRMLQAGEEVPADAVRLEEFINYFHYDYPQPAEGEPFSVTTELVPCPWNGGDLLLRVGLQAQDLDWDAMPKSNLVFLIDVSGSMYSADKLPLVKRAFGMLTENLRPDDVISIVTYASSDAVVLDGATGNEGLDIRAAIDALEAGGSTAGSKGIETAYALAEKHFIPGGNNRVILATDGDLNVGITSEGELVDLIEEKREGGVFLSVMGFGTGNIKDNKMEALADHGNGNYAYIDTPLEARRVLVEEMGGTLFTVAKDVKLQVEFNPARVKGYRLLGYENRIMAAEDFADDTKDGGEIGAGHRLTVLYEIAGPDSPVDIPGVELKYQEGEATGSDEWCTVSVRYKEPEGTESKLLTYPVAGEDEADIRAKGSGTTDTAFAACVAQFGMLLRDSEYKGEATYAGVLEQLESIQGLTDDPYKAEFLELVQALAETR